MTNSRRDRSVAESLFFVSLITLGVAAFAYPFQFTSLLEFSAFTTSKWCGLLIAIGAGVCLATSPNATNNGSGSQPKTSARAVLIFGALLLAYCGSLFYFSYYSVTAVFIVTSLLYLQGRHGIVIAGCTAGIWCLLVYVVFEKLFNIVLPVAL